MHAINPQIIENMSIFVIIKLFFVKKEQNKNPIRDLMAMGVHEVDAVNIEIRDDFAQRFLNKTKRIEYFDFFLD